jgi:hypothetical protein
VARKGREERAWDPMGIAEKGLETEEGESEASKVGGTESVTRGTDQVMVRWNRVRPHAEAMERWAAVNRGLRRR